MPDSLNDVQDILQQASSSQTKQVTVDGDVVEIQTPFSSPADWRDRIIYMIMIDRFNNPDQGPAHPVFDDDGNVNPVDAFQGGTIKGITEKLAYLQQLGATALWITPPLQNVQKLNGNPNEGTYHGYGIQHYLQVDPRFGTDEDLQELVEQAHARGMYVILDIVINHAGDVFSYQGHGSVAPFQDFPYDILWRDKDGNLKDEWHEAPAADDPNLTAEAAVFPHELRHNEFFRRQGSDLAGTVGDFFSLKELKTDFTQNTLEKGFHHPVRDIVIKAYQFAIAKFDVDGFRIDTLKHVERPFARIFANAVREFALSIGKKNFFIFGEVFDDDEKIAEYTGRFATDPDSLIGADAALDFPIFHVLPGVIKGFEGHSPARLAHLFEDRKELHRGQRGSGQVLVSTHGEASRFFVTFLDNHDQDRRFRFSKLADPNKFDHQVTMGIGCLLCLQGIPKIYYGTEQGLHGSGDSDKFVREALWGIPNAFDTNSPFYKAIQDIAAIHASQPALRYGRQFFRGISGGGIEFGISTSAPGIVSFSRILNDAEIVVLANTFTESDFSGFVIVDFPLNPDGTAFGLLYSNHGQNATPPGIVQTKEKGSVIIHHLRGGISDGPARVLSFTLKPMEFQILGTKPS